MELRSRASPMFKVVCLSQVTTVRKVGDNHSHRLVAELAPAITPPGKLKPHQLMLKEAETFHLHSVTRKASNYIHRTNT